jgi:hypothetical protein
MEMNVKRVFTRIFLQLSSVQTIQWLTSPFKFEELQDIQHMHRALEEMILGEAAERVDQFGWMDTEVLDGKGCLAIEIIKR